MKRSAPEKAFAVLNTAALTLLSIACLYPMLYVLFASFSEARAFSRVSGLIFHPVGFSVNGYLLVFQNPNILSGYLNTLLYVFGGSLISMVLSCLGAYALSRRSLLLRRPLLLLMIFTMYFSGGMIPSFLNVLSLGIHDTRWAILLPAAISTYNMIILRTAFLSIPQSLEESARIDGAGELTILLRIVLPLSTATLAVVFMYYAVAQWNSWFPAMIYLRNRKLWPLQTFLREILITGDMQTMSDVSSMGSMDDNLIYDSYQIVKYCTVIVATLPVLLMYPTIQRYFIKGVMVGSIKE